MLRRIIQFVARRLKKDQPEIKELVVGDQIHSQIGKVEVLEVEQHWVRYKLDGVEFTRSRRGFTKAYMR